MPACLRGPGATDYTGKDQHEEGQVNSPGLRLLLEVPCPWEPGDMTVRATITEKLLLIVLIPWQPGPVPPCMGTSLMLTGQVFCHLHRVPNLH